VRNKLKRQLVESDGDDQVNTTWTEGCPEPVGFRVVEER